MIGAAAVTKPSVLTCDHAPAFPVVLRHTSPPVALFYERRPGGFVLGICDALAKCVASWGNQELRSTSPSSHLKTNGRYI